jgi:CSLREA domain-containing protein
MKQDQKNSMYNFRSARAFFITAIILTLLLSAGANAAGLSFLDSLSEFFGWQKTATIHSATAAPILTGKPISILKNDVLSPDPRDDSSTSSINLNPPISQNFNGIGTSATATLPTDFKVDKNNTARSVGTYAGAGTATEIVDGASVATNAGNGIYNFGSGTTDTGADRAIGWLSSSTATKSGNLYVQVSNNTGSPLSGLTVGYDVEKYRNGQAGYRIQMFYSTDGSTWTTAGSNFLTSFNANANNNGFTTAPGSTTTVSNTLNQSIPVNGTFYLAWNYSVTSGNTTSNAQALAVDNVSITPVVATPGTVQFNAASYSDLEGTTTAITVNRVGGTLNAISVDYTVGGGTATGGAACTAGVDYINVPTGALNWADGNSTPKTFNVQLCNDAVVDTENLQLTLSNPVGTTITGTNPVTLDIIDNPPGTLQFFSASSNADENLPTAGIDVTRTGGSSGSVSADYAVTGGTATGGVACTAGVDYITPAPGTLTWTNGDAADKFINVQLCTDLITYEGPETVQLTLSNPQGGTALGGQTTTTLTINDVGAMFFNNTQISITGGASSPYPSNINVAGVLGPISDVKVRLFSFTHSFVQDVDMLLVSPSGQKFVLMSDIGGNTSITNRNYTFSDAAANFMVEGSNPSGTYKPTDFTEQNDDFESPAPSEPYLRPGPSGTDTLIGSFGGSDPNGTWSLYVRDAFPTGDNGGINAGWSLEIKTTAPGPGTVEFTAPASSDNEGALATVSVKRVTGGLGPISVDYATGNGSATGGAACGAGVDFINTSGTLSWADSDVDNKSFTVQLCPDGDVAEATETINLTLSNPVGTAISGTNPATLNIINNDFAGSSFSNHGLISIPDSGAASPYPSTVTVSGMTGTVSDMRVKLNGLSHSFSGDINMLLVGPQGQMFVILSSAGGGQPINATLTLTDSAAGFVPEPAVDGSYKPTSTFVGGVIGAPAPAPPYPTSGPAGADTFMSTFGGTNPNGVWSLYVYDAAGGDFGQVTGGWDLGIATAVPTPGTVEFSSASYNGTEGDTTTITANRVGGNLGPISVDYMTSSGTAVGGGLCGAGVDYVNTAGTLSWADGDSTPQTFTVSLCSDAEVGETTETANLTLSNPVGTVISGTNPATLNIENNSFVGSTFSNPAAIVIPPVGSSTPYPSTITVSGMTGAITEVRMVLKNFNHTYTSDVDILLVGPQGQKFVVMSDVGSNTASNDVTLTLRDSAADNMTAAPLANGSYKPTDIPSNPDNWAPPAPSGPYTSPAPWGVSTFASVFNGADPNGDWSLYVRDQFSPDSGSIAGGWDLQIATAETVRFNPGSYITTENTGTVSLPVVRPSSNYTATVDYTLGSAGALYPAVGGASCDSGIDYINTPGTLNFQIGELSKNIDVTLCDDGVSDGLKIILPELSNPTGGMVLGSPSTATVFINDDEPAPTLSVSDVTVNESAGTATFVVTQSFATPSLTQFLYSTSDGTALAGFDYTAATNASGTIPAGETSANIVIPIMNDDGFEETETFNVSLTSVVNATAADPAGVGTIIDDDVPAQYTVNALDNDGDGICDTTHCNLREAIIASNAVPGVINFAPGLTGTITFGAPPQITNHVVINGPGAEVLAISGNNIATVFEIPNAGKSVFIRGLTIRDGFNSTFGAGGNITNAGVLTVENSVITAGHGEFTGGIQTYGPLTIKNSTLSNNVGGVGASEPACASIGGAIDLSSELTINITNSTITGNSVATDCDSNSGAINLFAGRVVMTNSTVTNNSASSISAAIGGYTGTPSVIRNSIIAGNTGAATGADVRGVFESGGFNLIGNAGEVTAFSQPTDQVGSTLSTIDPMLGALANNGGHTPTHLPQVGSPAIDKGFSFGSTTDQRGSDRPSDNGAVANAVGGDGSDIGAVEVAVPASIQLSSAVYSDSETNADHIFNVTVSRSGSPAGAASVDFAVTDGTATVADGDYEISPATGTINWASGDSADKVIAIPVKGDTKFETDETVNIALSNVTGGAALGISSSVLTITNDDGEPTISVDDTVFGGDTLVVGSFTVSLSNPSIQSITVHYATADDTAHVGEDYTAVSGTLTFNPGETEKMVPVNVLPNTVNEATEQFFLNLDTPTNATIADAQGIGTIFDDDPQATVAIDDVTHAEGNSGTTTYTFTVTKAGGVTDQTVSVDYATFNGSAVSPSDFAAVSGTLAFGPAEFTKTITINVNGDTDFESDENFYVRLLNPVAVDIIDGEGVGTITNDDAATIYIVNINADTDDGVCDVTNCTLREAINAANATGGQINFAPNVTGSISLLSALPVLTNGNAIVINGPGANVLAVKRDASISALRIFDINGGGVYTISGLAINDGDVRPIGGAFNNLGGAIRIMNGRGVTINNCTFTNNWANNGAAIYNGANPATSPLTVNDSTFTANNANQSGGGIENRFSNTVTVNHSTFDANGAPFFGGGIHNLSNGVVFVNDSLFTGNAANSGAGIYNDDNGSITINRSNFIANHAQVGGAFGNKDGGMDFFNSTLSGNTSNGDGGAGSNRLGTVRFFNSTLSGNTSGNAGGAVYFTFEGASNGTFINCTIVGNHAGTGGGIMVFNGQSIVRFGNTIMAGNTALTQAPDLYGQIYSGGYNIFGKRSLASTFNEQPTDIIGSESSPANPVIGDLADNGGPTKTHALLAGSPAIDSGNPFGETADQRGYARIVNGTADRGAFEIQNAPASIAVFNGTPQSATVGTNYAPLKARVLDSNNDPVGGVPVTFNAPNTGASGTFPGSVFSSTAITDGNGVATAPVLTANNTTGSFQVNAGYAASPLATFDLTNLAQPTLSVNDVTFTGADSLVQQGFTVTLSAASASPVTVHYQTADGTAIAGEDYTAVSGTLTFDPGQTEKSIPVTILPDSVQENTEQFFLNLDSASSNAVIADAQGVGTIPNDDAEPTFAIDDVTQAEGNSGTSAFTFTITRTGDTALSSTVNYTTNNGSALSASDYVANAGSMTFLPNETTKQVSVVVNGDTTFENTETFTVDLTGTDNGTFTDNSGLGTITNDDAAPAFSIDDVTMNEGNGGPTAFTFTITKSGATALDSSVAISVADGTATQGSDHNGFSGLVTFLPGEVSKTATIIVNGDTVYENDETFFVNLFGPSNATISDAQGVGTIINDDAAPSFSIDDVTHNEGNSGTTAFTFTVTKNGGTELNSSVDFATADGTATIADNDYQSNSGTLTFLPADTTKTITVLVGGNYFVEPDEQFALNLSNAAGATISDGQGIGTILNDDATPTVTYVDDDWATGVNIGDDPDGAGPALAFGYDAFSTIQGGINGVAPAGTVHVYNGTYDEDVNANNAGVHLLGESNSGTIIRGPIGGPGTTVQIAASNVEVAGFTITRLGNNTTDWNNPNLNTVGVAIQGQSITGAVIHDNVLTGNRTAIDINNSNGHTVRNNVIDFNRQGLIFRNQTDNLTVVENFITNNWNVGVSFLDGSGGTNSPVQTALNSTFSNNNISGNWYAQIVDRQTGGLLPAPGTTNLKNFKGNWFGTTVPVTTTANSAEPGYAAQIPVAYGGTATAPGGQPDIAGPASANFQYQPQLLDGTDTNVETTPGRGTFGFQGVPNIPILNIQDQTFTGADSVSVQGFTVTLTGDTNQIVTVHYQTSDDSAIAGQDYTAANGTLTFNPGETSKVIPITILPDSVQEPTEQFSIDLDTPVNAGIIDGHAVGTIPNDDAGPTFSINDVTHSEGNSGTTSYTFTVTKTGSTALNSNVSFATQDGSAVSTSDYNGISGNVIFGPADITKQIAVQVNGDIQFENDEAFTLHLTGTDNGSITDADGTGTITNDDAAASVQFGAASYMEDESQTAVVNVTRTGDTTGGTTVSFATSDGTAIGGGSCSVGVDYIINSGTLVFDPGDTSKPINVQLCADTFPEPVQALNLTLSSPSAPAGLGTQSTTVVNINDTAGQFRSNVPIVINNNAVSNPYPATLDVSGAPVSNGSVRVTLYDVSHSSPEDLDILLVSPTGQTLVLMGNAGGGIALNAVTLTFADTASQVLPNSTAIIVGKYEPTNWVTPVTNFAAPAPAGPYSEPGSALGGFTIRNTFGAFNPNGTWSLYVRDRGNVPPLAPEGNGAIAGGWGLEFIAPTAANAEVGGRVLTADGRPIANVRVNLVGGNQPIRTVYTGQLGYYDFSDLPVGQTYVLTVKSRRFFFAKPSRLINLNADLTGEDFVAEPQE